MKSTSAVKAILFPIAIIFLLAGCGENDEMSQEEIQYLGHLDQSRFFQRQGELKASTLEARSAIQLQPDRVDPYIVIINNLLTAGDARNAELQLDGFMERIDRSAINQRNLNDAALLRAEARLMQQQYDAALDALAAVEDADRAQQASADLLEGHIQLASGNPDAARQAYQASLEKSPGAIEPLIGLSKTAFRENKKEESADYIRQANEIDSRNVDLWLWKARRAHADERWPEAETAYINALETIGQYDVMTYRKFETMSSLVDVLRQQGKAAEAFVYEEILAKSAPGTLRSNLIAAQEALNDGEPDRAAGFLEEVLTQAPSHEQAAMMLGLIRFRQGRAEEAERLLAPIAAMDESDQANRVLAATRLQLSDPEGAKAILANIEDQDSDPATLALVGIASLASGDAENGRQLIEKSLEMNPDNNSLRLRYANYHLQNGDTARAIELARAAVDRDSASAPARQTLIRAQLASGDSASAITTASDWLKNEPGNVQALVVRGDLARQAGNLEQAKGLYQQANQAAPDDPIPLLALGNLELSAGNQQQARALFADALRLEPDSRQALQSLMAITPREDMEPLMAELRKTNPDAIGPRLMLLESALIKRDQALADELTAGLIEREEQSVPTAAEPLVAGVYNSIAAQMAQRERIEDAAAIFARGRSLFPEDETLGLQSAALNFRQDNATDARKILSDVKQAHPDSPSPFVVEARYFEQRQDFTQAAELYQLALEKAPRNPGLMMSLASVQQSDNKPDEALKLYQELIALQPNHAAALNNLAWIYQEQGNEEALSVSLKAYELDPQNAAIADTYGWILLKNGQQAESVEILEKAHKLAPGSEEIAMHLAEAYKATGDDDRARALLEKLQ